ncbi:MAG: T9SS type A sorting domain-containing protein [Bacteroidia bacterium]|nr:T9SS type A sorting domain-containing protein [Bacteroidia bacterium]
MRKISLLLGLFVAWAGSQAQCTPDPLAFLPLNPTPVDTLIGYVNVPFTQTITINVPADTTVNVPAVPPFFPGGLYTLNIIKQQLISIDGMPNGFTYSCNNAGCVWGGGDAGCWKITGTPDQPGVFALACNISTTIADPAPGISLPTTPVPFTYTLKVLEANAIEDQLNENAFRFAACKPSPASGMTMLNFSYPSNTQLALSVLDMAGRTIKTENIRTFAGINSFILNLSGIQPGIYLLNLSDGKKMLQQKLVIQ